MKMKLLKSVVVSGHPGANVGDVLEVPSNVFQLLEGMGAAKAAVDGLDTIQQREPEVGNRDPQPEETQPGKSSKRTRAK